MWPFKNKPKPKKRRRPNPFKALPVGTQFKYLGVRMIVCAHRLYRHAAHGFSCWDPTLYADYVDKKGVLQQAEFGVYDVPAILAQNKTRKSCLT